jgi:ribosome biogenesis GTPase
VIKEARVIKSTGSWYVVETTDGATLDARLRGKFKLENKKISNPIAVGDWVSITEDGGNDGDWVIEKIKDRENYIIRKSPKKTAHGHILAANIDQAVIIATVNQPKTSNGFIDRFLVTTESYRIPTIIVFNKKDILTAEELEDVMYLRDQYAKIGYQSHLISSLSSADTTVVKALFANKLTLIAGHSGVGKSTLINSLIPTARQQTAGISRFANKGVHTTTFAEIFTLAPNSYIIDSPGIKELGIMEIENSELSHFFPEMRSYLGQCKFHNCMHLNEPGCKVLEALSAEKIWHSRYLSYLSILEGDDNRR